MPPSLAADSIHALILDIDGTLLHGDRPAPGLEGLFEYLERAQVPFVIASNNATKSPETYRQKLAAFGISLDGDAVITSGVATVTYVKARLKPAASLYVIGETALLEALQEAGFTLVKDASNPVEAVVVGGDSNLTYDKLKNATLLLRNGAAFIGTNPDVVYPTEEGLIPETGTTLAALQAATGIAPMVIGKPARYLFDAALGLLDSRPNETAVVGDRLDTDIHGGMQAGLKTILITTGVDDEKSIAGKEVQPDGIVNSLDDLVDFLQGVP